MGGSYDIGYLLDVHCTSKTVVCQVKFFVRHRLTAEIAENAEKSIRHGLLNRGTEKSQKDLPPRSRRAQREES